eukprot:3778443-Prymnesium_polylepis.1
MPAATAAASALRTRARRPGLGRMATTRWAAKSEKSDTIPRKVNEAVIATCFSGARGKPSRRCRWTRSSWPEPPAKVGSQVQ